MKFMIDLPELKSSLSGLLSVAKKMPSGLSGDAPVSFVHIADGSYVMALCYEEFAATVPIKTFIVMGDEDVLGTYDGGGVLSADSVIGISDYERLLTVLKKLKQSQPLDFEYARTSPSSSTRELVLSTQTGTFRFMCCEPRKLCSLFPKLGECDTTVMSLAPDVEADVMLRCSTLSTFVKESVSQPAYGCVCLSSEDDDMSGMHLRVSATSNVDGYTVSYDDAAIANNRFHALIGKKSALALKGLTTQFDVSDDTSVSVDYVDGSDVEASRICFSNSSYSIWMRCMGYVFPFGALSTLLSSSNGADAVIKVSATDFSTCLSRTSAMVDSIIPETRIDVHDGGAITISTPGRSGNTSGCDAIRDVTLVRFPDDVTDYGITVSSDILDKVTRLYQKGSYIWLFVQAGANGMSGRIAICDSDSVGADGLSSVLVEHRI